MLSKHNTRAVPTPHFFTPTTEGESRYSKIKNFYCLSRISLKFAFKKLGSWGHGSSGGPLA
jgi:hypothetical protein